MIAAGCGHDHGPNLARVHKGMTKQEVRDTLGPPDGRYSIPYPTPGELDEGFEDCWTYGLASDGTRTGKSRSLYQLCFWNGKLAAKARYG